MRLVVQIGPETGREFRLTKGVTTIGRDPGNDIVLSDTQTSRRHAEIQRRDNEFLIADLGSTNGTFVNESRVTAPHVLRHGDSVRVGNTTFSFQVTREEAVPGGVWGPPIRREIAPLPIILIVGAIFLVIIIVVFASPPIILRPTPMPSPIMTSTATPIHTSTPTRFVTSTPAPTSTPTMIPTATPIVFAECPYAGACITYPTVNAVLRGVVQIKGSAYIEDFDYYKFEFRSEGEPEWSFIQRFEEQVTAGVLGAWDTSPLSAGKYWFRLLVIKKDGNYESCEVPVTIR